MTDELIDILSDDHDHLKTALKSEAHKNGWLHASVHIWFYTASGKILLQKRSANKIAFPNLWDVSVAGHIEAGESNCNAAIREIKEEIGLDIQQKDLFKIGLFKEIHHHKTDFIDNELHHIYICELKSEIEKLNIQIEELSAIKLISIKQFKEELNSNKHSKSIVPHDLEYYTFTLKCISEKIKSK